MALLRYRSCHLRLISVVGMMLAGIVIIVIHFTCLIPQYGTLMPLRVMPSLPVILDVSGSQLGQPNKGGGGGGKCVCRQESGLALESKHDGAMDGHYLDVNAPPPCTQQPLLHGIKQQAVQSTGGADTPKEVKQDGVFKQQPRSVDVGDYRQTWVFRSLKEGQKMRETLVMAIIIDGTQLEWVKSVYATWGRDASHLVFYTEGQSNTSIQEARRQGLQVVKLNTSTNMHTRLALLQHLSEHYGKSHQWFVVVTEDTYVHMDQLEAVLGRLSPEEPLLLGLPPYCQVRGRHSGSSMVLNQALLSLLTDQLHLCLNKNMKVADNHGSAEIEACVSENMNLHCSISSSMQAYFVEAEEGQTSISARLQQSQNKLFSLLLTYSPLRQTKDMYILHYHYKKTQLVAAMDKTKHLQQEVKQVCSSLGPSILSAKDCNSTLLREVVQSHHQSSSKCPTNEVILTMTQPFHPKSIGDYFSWQYFDSHTIYNDQSHHPSHSRKSKRYVEEEVQQASIQALQKTSIGLRKGLKFKRLVNGWVRHDPFMGNEYIFDYLFTDGRAEISKRASLVRPLAKNYISLKDKFVNTITVNIIVPTSGVKEKLTKFMSMYENLVLTSRRNVSLIFPVYGQEDVATVETLLAQYHMKYKFANVKMVKGKGEFSKSKAIHLGLSQLLPNDLAFVCDVDMVISPSFLDRCRSNAVQSSRVYFPEVFKQYNMDYVYWNRRKSNNPGISRETGYWCYYGFGMVCIYKSDYDSVGGMDINITGWGGEDVSFFHRVLKKRLQVMRAPDVGLMHLWHSKYCAKTLSAKQYANCQSSKVEDLASKRELAKFVYGQLKTTTAEARHDDDYL